MDSGLIMVVAMISIVVGYVGGAAVSSILFKKKAAAQAGKATATEGGAGEPYENDEMPVAHGAPTGQRLLAPDSNRVEIALLWRELPNGDLRADMTGITVKNSTELSDEQRNLLRAIHADLNAWLESKDEYQPASAAGSLGLVRSAMPQSPKGAAPVASVASDLPARQAVPVKPGGESQTHPLAQSPVADNPNEKGPKASPSIVAQINDILQAQIKGTSLERRGIRLIESPFHGVSVWIGLNSYPGLDSVPDEEVNTAIRTAVKTWESHK